MYVIYNIAVIKWLDIRGHVPTPTIPICRLFFIPRLIPRGSMMGAFFSSCAGSFLYRWVCLCLSTPQILMVLKARVKERVLSFLNTKRIYKKAIKYEYSRRVHRSYLEYRRLHCPFRHLLLPATFVWHDTSPIFHYLFRLCRVSFDFSLPRKKFHFWE